MGRFKIPCFAILNTVLVITSGIFISDLIAEYEGYGSWIEATIGVRLWQLLNIVEPANADRLASTEVDSLQIRLRAAQQRMNALQKKNKELGTRLAAKKGELLQEERWVEEEMAQLQDLEHMWAPLPNDTQALRRARADTTAAANPLSSHVRHSSPSERQGTAARLPRGGVAPALLCKPGWRERGDEPSPDFLPWNPAPHKYLAALCGYGQMSNHLICIKKHMAFAALLNRTLILPRKWQDETHYEMDWVIDLAHFRKCLGNLSVVSVEEYLELESKHEMEVNLLCWWSAYCRRHMSGCRKARKAIPQLRLKGGTCTQLRDLPLRVHLHRVLTTFGHLEDQVISLGDLFGVRGILEMPDLFLGLDGPFRLADSCHMARRPAPEIIESARRFVAQALPQTFLAVHVRRGDFFSHCIKAKTRIFCWLSLAKLGHCIAQRLKAMARLGISTIYLATNGSPQETTFLKERIRTFLNEESISFVQLPELKGADWAQPLVTRQWSENPRVAAEVEKIICAMGTVFLGYYGSSYSREISRLREGFAKSTCFDKFICENATEKVPLFYP